MRILLECRHCAVDLSFQGTPPAIAKKSHNRKYWVRFLCLLETKPTLHRFLIYILILILECDYLMVPKPACGTSSSYGLQFNLNRFQRFTTILLSSLFWSLTYFDKLRKAESIIFDNFFTLLCIIFTQKISLSLLPCT